METQIEGNSTDFVVPGAGYCFCYQAPPDDTNGFQIEGTDTEYEVPVAGYCHCIKKGLENVKPGLKNFGVSDEFLK